MTSRYTRALQETEEGTTEDMGLKAFPVKQSVTAPTWRFCGRVFHSRDLSGDLKSSERPFCELTDKMLVWNCVYSQWEARPTAVRPFSRSLCRCLSFRLNLPTSTIRRYGFHLTTSRRKSTANEDLRCLAQKNFWIWWSVLHLVVVTRHVARIVSLGAASVFGGRLLYCYSLLAMSTVSVTE